MKRAILYLLVVTVIGMIVVNGLKGVPQQEDRDKDNYGRVIGQMVDAETGKPVHEQFSLYLYASDGGFIAYISKTDQNGYFMFNWKPGQFFINSKPEASESEYCLEFHPLKTPETQTGFTIERGKITKITKRIIKGGKMKITLVDPSGSPINPGILFKNLDIRAHLSNISIKDSANFRQIGKLESGVATLFGIWPGEYRLNISFRGMGYSGQEKHNIVVESKRTTEIKVVIDLNNKTGVHGRVFDKNGTCLKNIEVTLYTDRLNEISVASTNNSGYYKIIGIEEGVYRIGFVLNYGKNNSTYFCPSEEILIKNNILIKKDKMLDIVIEDFR